MFLNLWHLPITVAWWLYLVAIDAAECDYLMNHQFEYLTRGDE